MEWIEHMWEAILVYVKVQQPVSLGAVMTVMVYPLAVTAQSKDCSPRYSSLQGNLFPDLVETPDIEEASRMYMVFGVVAGDELGKVLIADNVDFEDIVEGCGDTLSTENHMVAADTIAVRLGTADPDKDKPYRSTEILSEYRQEINNGVMELTGQTRQKAATTLWVTQ